MSTGLTLSSGHARTATHDLTHVGLVLAPHRGSARRWLGRSLLVGAALAAGAGLGYTVRDRALPVVLAPPPGPSAEMQRLQEELERARAELRMSGAQSQELERQVDALNLRLREATLELTFIRKAREGRQP